MTRWVTILLLLFSGSCAFARAPEEAEFVAASMLGDEVAHWILKMNRGPMAIGLFSVNANPPFEQDYSTIVEAELMKGLAKAGIEKISACPECRTPHVMVTEERLIVKKGAPDLETLKKIGLKQPVDAFLTVDLYRTKLAVIAQVVLYQNPTAVVIAAERFRVPAMNLTEGAVQVLVSLGFGRSLGSSSSSTALATALGLSLMEEVGFGKAGLGLGVVTGSTTLIYLNPTLALFGRFGSSALVYSMNAGLGFGFAGSDRGIVVRGAYEIYMGSLAVAGFEASYFIPATTTSTSAVTGFVGVHIGLAFGK